MRFKIKAIYVEHVHNAYLFVICLCFSSKIFLDIKENDPRDGITRKSYEEKSINCLKYEEFSDDSLNMMTKINEYNINAISSVQWYN